MGPRPLHPHPHSRARVRARSVGYANPQFLCGVGEEKEKGNKVKESLTMGNNRRKRHANRCFFMTSAG